MSGDDNTRHRDQAAEPTPRERPVAAASVDDPPSDELVGRKLGGRYELLACVGEGGMGRVYKASDHALAGRFVAVKLMAPALAQNPAMLARFRREVAAMARLPKSPNLLPPLDTGTDGPFTYLVTPLLEGECLRDALKRVGRFTVNEALPLFREMVSGVALAHRHGIIHRDLKPSNVFLEDVAGQAQPVAVVLDLGIARIQGEDTQPLTAEGFAVGTPAYKAPEMFELSSGDPHPGLDVYALGLIAHEMLTGKRVYPSEERAAREAHASGATPAPLSSLAAVPAAVSDIVERALARDPSERYRDAGELLAALDDMSRGLSAAAFPAGTSVNDRYTIQECLGEGGMGIVYRAIDTRDDSTVALKVIQPHLAEDKDYVRRFSREAELLIALAGQHPHVVRLRDKDRFDGMLYYVMEFVEGGSLAELADDLGWDGIVDKLGGVAEALDFLHSRGVVHRDIKADNIVVEQGTGRAVLIDFGIAREGQGDSTRTGTRLGTTGFMPPEQLEGARRAVPASDQWALAATLYELLTGRVPGGSVAESRRSTWAESAVVEHSVLSGRIAALAGLRPDVEACAPGLSDTLARALAMQPDARFETVTRFHQELRRSVGKGVSLTPPVAPTAASAQATAATPSATPMAATTTQTVSVAPRRWLTTAMAVAGAAAIAAVAWYGARAQESPPIATTPARVAAEPAPPAAIPEHPDAAPSLAVVQVVAQEDGKVVEGVRLAIDDNVVETPTTVERPVGASIIVEVIDDKYTGRALCTAGDAAACVVELERPKKRRTKQRRSEPAAKPPPVRMKFESFCQSAADCPPHHACQDGRCVSR